MEGQQGAQAASTGASCGCGQGLAGGCASLKGRAGQAACGKGLQPLPPAWQEKAGWQEGWLAAGG